MVRNEGPWAWESHDVAFAGVLIRIATPWTADQHTTPEVDAAADAWQIRDSRAVSVSPTRPSAMSRPNSGKPPQNVCPSGTGGSYMQWR